MLTGGTLPLQEQLQFMLQAIDGLIHAHSREVFNCDLKLENIFVWPDGSVAVGDFGLAVHGAQTPPGLRCEPLRSCSHCGSFIFSIWDLDRLPSQAFGAGLITNIAL